VRRLALVPLLLAAAGCGGGPTVVALDGEGRAVAGAALPADGRFALTYRHSVYKAAAEERDAPADEHSAPRTGITSGATGLATMVSSRRTRPSMSADPATVGRP